MTLHFIGFTPATPQFTAAVAQFGPPTHQHAALTPAALAATAPGHVLVFAHAVPFLPTFIHFTVPATGMTVPA